MEEPWRGHILAQAKSNHRYSESFSTVFKAYNELTETVIDLRARASTSRASLTSLATQEEIDALKKQNLTLKEELTELYRRRSENAQALLDANKNLQARDTRIARLAQEVKLLTGRLDQSGAQIEALNDKINDLSKTIDLQGTEYIALQATHHGAETKLRKLEDENNRLIERWRELKQKEVDMLNTENEKVVRQREKKLESQLVDAASAKIPQFDADHFELLDGPGAGQNAGKSYCIGSAIPTKATLRFEAHDGEVTSLKWASSGRNFATGGSDRRLKLWEIDNNGKQNCIAMFHGCNQSVMDIEFDVEGENILAASNDNVVRIWSIPQQRLRHTFNGHTNNVLAAKYMRGTGGNLCVVSGSRDRTLKFWDLRTDSCTSSKFPGSTCNDLATFEGSGVSVVSAHHDKKLRFWDVRQKREVAIAELPDKITSVRLSSESLYVLASCRDDLLHYYDIRYQRPIRSFGADGFRLAHDTARAALAPDDQFCAMGSSDGVIFTWSILTGVPQSQLRHHDASVLSCAWDPSGTVLVSTDRDHKVVVWKDY